MKEIINKAFDELDKLIDKCCDLMKNESDKKDDKSE